MGNRRDLRKLETELTQVNGRPTRRERRTTTLRPGIRLDTPQRTTAPLVDGVTFGIVDDGKFTEKGGRASHERVDVKTALTTVLVRGRSLDMFVIRKSDIQHDQQYGGEVPTVAGHRLPKLRETSTTGGSVPTWMDVLRQASAEVVGVAVIVDRGAEKAVCAAGLSQRSAYSLADLGQEA